ncbi:MAG TPA: hypothetical protein VGS19_36905 [Streptosporangiaceae bacterium]|nr:hypothetical protein [Streptosporangiaceae bacterium]
MGLAHSDLGGVFRVNLEGRSGDTAQPGERAERALDLLHGVGRNTAETGRVAVAFAP